MRLFPTILASLLTLPVAGQHIVFPLDNNPVTVDGVLHAAEWQYAETASIAVTGMDYVTVMYKHDNTAMYFAFTGKLESANMLFPEIVTDAANLGGATWTSGQWWLHVSATNCENNGGYGVFNDCKASQPGWEAAPNFASGTPITDTVEIRVPFAKIGFNPAAMDTMGIAFLVTNTATVFRTFPGSADRYQPTTWAKATFSKIPAGIDSVNGKMGKNVYPNPAADKIYVNGLMKGSIVSLVSIDGRRCGSFTADATSGEFALGHFPPGWYLVEVADSYGKYYHKVYKL
ncbi:MAG: T9SS type A sorting domain-containing protein [Taibaiella sp.]|nr:T9SS type A sorting domain-containing protein [Taibaiella sp.]